MTLRGRSRDRTRDKPQDDAGRAFKNARNVERQYASRLRKVARHIGDIVKGVYDPTDASSASQVSEALRRYGSIIEGWAKSVATRMVAEVAARDRKAWMEVSQRMGRGLREEIASAPTGQVMRARLAEQVRLIKSLPIDAAERVHKLTVESITEGKRASEIATEIMRTGEVSKSKANTIARTEVSRTATELTRARAEHVGSKGYIWRTAGDSDVRPSHRAMAGKYVAWEVPPTLDGMTGHAGEFPNCRCYPEPVIPDE